MSNKKFKIVRQIENLDELKEGYYYSVGPHPFDTSDFLADAPKKDNNIQILQFLGKEDYLFKFRDNNNNKNSVFDFVTLKQRIIKELNINEDIINIVSTYFGGKKNKKQKTKNKKNRKTKTKRKRS